MSHIYKTLNQKEVPNGIDFDTQLLYTKSKRKSVRSVVEYHDSLLEGFPLVHHDLFSFRRYGVRIMVDRKTKEARVYQGAFSRTVKLRHAHRVWETKTGIDAFLEQPLWMYNPKTRKWYQVSIMGVLYELDTSTMRSHKVDLKNTLHHASLLVCGGQILMWTTDVPGVPTWTCPITLEDIPMDRMELGIEPCTCSRLPRNEIGLLEKRPWYFTGCGHVFSYQKGLVPKRSCPVCRTCGEYQPLFLGMGQDVERVECVFVPCGHVVSKEDAMTFSQDILIPVDKQWVHACPTCTTPIETVCKLFVTSFP
jgi:hypothetical protein